MPNNINPAEVSKVLLDQLKSLNNDVKLEEVGTVLQISDGVARIYGLLNATASELLEFEDGTIGVVMNLEEDNVGAVRFIRRYQSFARPAKIVKQRCKA